MSDGLVSLNGDGFSFVGMVENLSTAKGDGAPHTLAVLIPKEDYNLAVAKNIMQTVLLSALLLFCAVVCCLYLARRYLAPVHRDLDRLRDEDRGGEQMAFSDFEPISATLQAQDREHEKIITTLEQEKQTVQEQAVQLLDKNEALQGQFEAAQADAQRRELTAKNEKAAAEREERLISAARMEARKVALAARQEMVDKAYDLALEKLCAMPEKTYVETVAQLLAQAAPNGQGEVILNPQVSASMGPAIVERANALIGGGKLTLSKTAREIRGGFILKCGNVEVNGTFETLVRLQRTQNAGAVAKQLFPEA